MPLHWTGRTVSLTGNLGIQRELLSRYAADYEIMCEASVASALERLDVLRVTSGAQVLVLFAADQMKTMTGIEYLQRAHELHPCAAGSADPVGKTDRRSASVSAGRAGTRRPPFLLEASIRVRSSRPERCPPATRRKGSGGIVRGVGQTGNGMLMCSSGRASRVGRRCRKPR
jgi:hypothetical protein